MVDRNYEICFLHDPSELKLATAAKGNIKKRKTRSKAKKKENVAKSKKFVPLASGQEASKVFVTATKWRMAAWLGPGRQVGGKGRTSPIPPMCKVSGQGLICSHTSWLLANANNSVQLSAGLVM